MQGIYTVLRDRTSTRQDFIFFTDRLATLLVERAMEKLPYREVTIETPVGAQTKGKAIDVGVCFSAFSRIRPVIRRASTFTEPMWRDHPSIVSARNPTKSVRAQKSQISGGPLEQGLQRVISDVPIGSLLVQSDSKTGEPLLFQAKLPNCIRQRHRAVNTWVFLLDAQAGLF